MEQPLNLIKFHPGTVSHSLSCENNFLRQLTDPFVTDVKRNRTDLLLSGVLL